MKVFKFGGASIKDAESVKNVSHVLTQVGFNNTFMVMSAMGKTTNALEEVVKLYFSEGDYQTKVDEIEEQHIEIAKGLFEPKDPVCDDVRLFFEDLKSFLRRNKSPNYSFVYDQVVCCGELISTKIISAYLNRQGIQNEWLDVRDYIKTDDTYREGKVNWKITEEKIKQLNPGKFYITQGFLGSDPNYFTTTLGREGSDYSAAIFAYCLGVKSMTIWKDVPGVLNADPRYFEKPQLLHRISYEEAIELAYYGASVIHPKTLQPLQKKEIPLHVKSFINPTNQGTVIKRGELIEPLIPCYILKKNQQLLTLTTQDFSFITEDKVSGIFNLLYDYKLKVNLMQNSAITLTLCLEDTYGKVDLLVKELESNYKTVLEREVNLYTIHHFDPTKEEKVKEGVELLRQTVKNTLQIVVKTV